MVMADRSLTWTESSHKIRSIWMRFSSITWWRALWLFTRRQAPVGSCMIDCGDAVRTSSLPSSRSLSIRCWIRARSPKLRMRHHPTTNTTHTLFISSNIKIFLKMTAIRISKNLRKSQASRPLYTPLQAAQSSSNNAVIGPRQSSR